MSKTDIAFRDNEIAAIMPHYPVGPVVFTRPCSGTANAGVVVVTREGQFFLKRRNPRYCDAAAIAYDHHVLKALVRAGLPCPRVINTIPGSRWLEHDGQVYELFEFIDGTVLHTPDDAQLAAAGDILARLHQVTEALSPPGSKGFGRLWDPLRALQMLEPFIARAVNGDTGSLGAHDRDQAAAQLGALAAQLRQIATDLPDSEYAALPHAVIHGDWHPANVKYSGATIAGIFDFDWVDRQPRRVDVADGLLFFCGLRHSVGGSGDIWTLTEAPTLQIDRMRTFMAGYAAHIRPTAAEAEALPDLMAARWIYARIDAAVRKVDVDDQVRFILRDVLAPLQWLAEHRAVISAEGWWA